MKSLLVFIYRVVHVVVEWIMLTYCALVFGTYTVVLIHVVLDQLNLVNDHPVDMHSIQQQARVALR